MHLFLYFPKQKPVVLGTLFFHLVVGKVQSINSCQIKMTVISANIFYAVDPMRKVDSGN